MTTPEEFNALAALLNEKNARITRLEALARTAEAELATLRPYLSGRYRDNISKLLDLIREVLK